jgi:hypothetical protein
MMYALIGITCINKSNYLKLSKSCKLKFGVLKIRTPGNSILNVENSYHKATHLSVTLKQATNLGHEPRPRTKATNQTVTLKYMQL